MDSESDQSVKISKILKEKRKEIGGDIELENDEQVNQFFLMDSDEEREQYGTTTKASLALTGTKLIKNQKQEKEAKAKQIMDFKIKVLDFLAIYIKEAKQAKTNKMDTIKLVQGLLQGMQIAHQDKNNVLFERIKTVLGLLARSSSGQQVNQENLEEQKILLNEVMALALRPTKDGKIHQAYLDCLFTLTKQLSADGIDNKGKQTETLKFVCSTYKSILKKFLGGRGASSHSLNANFFQRVFEECDQNLSQALIGPLLKYILPAIPDSQNDKDNLLGEKDLLKGKDSTEKSRSVHQRFQAVEIFSTMVRSSQKNSQLLEALADNIELIGQVLIKVVKHADTWQQKKVKKTMVALAIFTKLVNQIQQSKSLESPMKYRIVIENQGSQLIKEIESAVEKDKGLSNLKGKLKEIKALI